MPSPIYSDAEKVSPNRKVMSYANGSSNNGGSFINGLGVAAAPDTGALTASPGGSPAQNPRNLTGTKPLYPTTPNNQVKPVKGKSNLPPPPQKAIQALSAIGKGQIHGAYVPKDAPRIKSSLTPEAISGAGIGMYRPFDKQASLVLYNPKRVPLSTLKKIDKAGGITKAFPNFTKLIGLGATGAGGGAGTGAGGPSGKNMTAPDTSQPPGHDTPSPGIGPLKMSPKSDISDMNLTGKIAPAAPPVSQVLPKPMGSGANQQLATARIKAMTGGPAPGGIVNNLFKAPV